MKWLKRKIRIWLDEDLIYPIEKTVCLSDGPDIDGLRFNVMSASGGTIVQIRHYDRKTDSHNYITHVIPDGENVADRIGQIVSMEILRS